MPLQRRVPKFGFKNVNRKEYKGVNVSTLQELADRADAEGQAGFTLDLHGEDAHGRTVVTSRAHYQLRPSRGHR